jgi:hypothetical protein
MRRNMLFAAALLPLLVGCGSTKDKVTDATTSATMQKAECEKIPPTKGGTAAFLPKASIYRMNGDYHLNVPITVSASGELLSFPDPVDIRPNAAPIPLANGYWLDRRGVSELTAFTSYTYEEYAALAAVPSADELKAHIIPGAMVTEVILLPMRPNVAAKDTAAVNAIIREGLPQCEVKYQLPTPNVAE